MKKKIAMLLACAIAFALTGCGGGDVSESGSQSFTSQSESEPVYYEFRNDQYLWVSYGHTPEPGARIIGSAQSLDGFLAQFSWFDPSEVQNQYDEAYFETGRLLAVVVEEPSGSIRHQISPQGLRRDEVEIVRVVPSVRTCDMAAWLILAEVDTMFDDGDELALTVVDSIDDDGDELSLTIISPEDDTKS